MINNPCFATVKLRFVLHISIALLHNILEKQQPNILYALSREEEIESSIEAVMAL